jgi:NAD(P)-dependent dehydrogenase (short-subunit alcohol dehydrogenase family)
MSEGQQGRLAGKVAIVTGAGTSGEVTGTGQAMSTLFARHGAAVVLLDRVAANARRTLAAIEAEGGTGLVFEADVTDESQCEAACAAAVARFGGLVILVNNVGIHGSGRVTDFDAAEWDRTLAVNLKGAMLMAKHAVRAMIERGGGAVVNIASVDGIRAGGWHNLPYAASKGGIITATTHMAVHHGHDNVRVNCIAPGMIYTEMVSGRLAQRQGLRERRRRGAPLGTEGSAWDIAWAALFLASDESRWITGVTLPVDAGLLASTPLSMLEHLREE